MCSPHEAIVSSERHSVKAPHNPPAQFSYHQQHIIHLHSSVTTVLYELHETDRRPFSGLFPGQPGQASTRHAASFWTLMKQEMIGWQWHQLDHVQLIYTSLQTDDHASTLSLSFYRSDALPDTQPTVSKCYTKFNERDGHKRKVCQL